MKILIIEEDTSLLESLTLSLTEKGHTVDSAQSGITGLHRAIVDKFDVIFLSCDLSDMDGLDVYWKLQENDTPVLLLASQASLNDVLYTLQSK